MDSTYMTEEIGLNSQPNIFQVAKEHVGCVWEVLRSIAQANPRGLLDRMDESDLAAQLAEGQLQLWFMVDDGQIEGAVLTSFVCFAHVRELWVVWAGGQGQMRKYLRPGTRQLIHYATICRCSSVKMIGRTSWARALRNTEWKQREVVLEVPVQKRWMH